MATSATCKPEWKANAEYQTGDKVQWKGREYLARWWTRGNEPGKPAFIGLDGSGKVWRDEGACH
ncbi:carbohydrate-binding protein [Pseudomonas boanensis]|uniref:carbohydrate-binding protein n=1 Tax=Metapseudomonas boanensis TaxID=2822138 RepID=UPI0035D490B5